MKDEPLVIKEVSLENKYVYNIELIKSKEDKIEAIKACDIAMKCPLLDRKNFEELFRKIDAFAEFLRAYSGEVMGYVAFYLNDINKKEAYITLLVVNPQFQKKHIGTELINTVCEIAKKKGFKYIKLEVAVDNSKAIEFYKKNGFKVISDNENKSYYMRRDV